MGWPKCNSTLEHQSSTSCTLTSHEVAPDTNSLNSPRTPHMEEGAVSSHRPHHLRHLWPHSGLRLMVPHLATLHPLSETMGATTHYSRAVHGSHLRYRILPVLLLLQTFDLFRSSEGLLRGVCNCELLCAVVPLPCVGPS